MKYCYPCVKKIGESVVFDSGSLLQIPKEYLKKDNIKKLNEFYLSLDFETNEPNLGIDPLLFNYITYRGICFVGLVIELPHKSIVNNNKKKYPQNVFDKRYILEKVVEEQKMYDLEEYLPTKFVSQNLHELRNLNSKIVSRVDAIINAESDAEWEKIFDNADENIKKIYVASRLTRFILDNFKLCSPNYIEEWDINDGSSFVIHRSVSKIVKIYQNDFKKRKGNITLTGQSYCQMGGNKEAFEIILMLLIENAIKYSNDINSLPPKIEIIEEKNKLKIVIQSFGKTIPEEDIPHIFNRGYRSSAHSNQTGSGMGLYNAKKLLEKFNSTLQYSKRLVNNNLGWNTFTIVCNSIIRENK